MKTKILRENAQALGFILSYATIIVVLIAINHFNSNLGLNLSSERDRTLFQGFTVLGLALFIIFQFDLDYRNRKRNILYGEQIKALLEEPAQFPIAPRSKFPECVKV